MPQQISETSPIGRDTQRVDGPLKVTGKAQYASDYHFPGLLYGVPVEATIANGKVTKLDTAAAEKLPNVRAIFRRDNIGKIFRSVPGEGFEGICDERRPPFEDDTIRYYGQYVALAHGRVIGAAPTFDEARALVQRLQPTPEYYLVFPAGVEPDFDVVYDLTGSA